MPLTSLLDNMLEPILMTMRLAFVSGECMSAQGVHGSGVSGSCCTDCVSSLRAARRIAGLKGEWNAGDDDLPGRLGFRDFTLKPRELLGAQHGFWRTGEIPGAVQTAELPAIKHEDLGVQPIRERAVKLRRGRCVCDQRILIDERLEAERQHVFAGGVGSFVARIVGGSEVVQHFVVVPDDGDRNVV